MSTYTTTLIATVKTYGSTIDAAFKTTYDATITSTN